MPGTQGQVAHPLSSLARIWLNLLRSLFEEREPEPEPTPQLPRPRPPATPRVEPEEREQPKPAMMSRHFSVREFTHSDTAVRLGIDNSIPFELWQNAVRTAEGLEAIKVMLGGVPIYLSSGYRCAALNAAVGGATTSDHVKCDAADFTAPAFGSPLAICRAIAANPIIMARVDQLIHEYGRWVHVSFGARRRGQLLTIEKGRTMPGLHAVIR
jgi:zinc D-Ala-D-Ala carboxypeptidase